MAGRAYAWIATQGGVWSLASNWDDLTDGIDPSQTVPGPQDDVTVSGATGNATSSITGTGAALAAAFFNNVSLAGDFAFGGFSLGLSDSGGLLTIGAGAIVTSGSAAIGSGSLFVSGAAASLSVTGSVVLGDGQAGYGAAACNLDATSGGRVLLGALTLNASSASIYVDPTSIVEIGTGGAANPGALTIDAGAALTGQGDANAYAAVVNNGTITASGGDLLVGATTGTGTLAIAGGATLTLNGAIGAGQSVVFSGAEATLALATEFDQPHGSVTGFVSGDGIDLIGDPISAASYTATGNDTGVLTLFYGSQVADTFTLLGNYTGDVFLTAPDGAGGTLITVAPESGGNGNPSQGTNTPDQYLWIAPGSGNWKSAANWKDVTTGASPARIAPGVNNLVTINGQQSGGFTVIAGPANAASLSLTGNVAMGGTYAIGAIVMGIGGDNMVGGTFDLLPGTVMTAASVAIMDGGITATGGALLAVSGTIALGGGQSGIGLPVTALSATSGATITCAGLTLGGGSGDTVTTDPTSFIEIGAVTGAAAGAITIGAGATVAGNGEVNPFGALVDDGTITAQGGTLVLGSVTGTGVLTLAASATLTLDAGTALPVFLNGAGVTLAIADELVALTGVITGFAPGDAIDIDNDPITAVAAHAIGANTILDLYYGSIQVASFTLAGSYSGDKFIVVPDGAGGTDVLTEKSGGGGGGGGQGDTDLLAWANPVSGPWNHASNWFDITTNTAATAPPDTLNPVQIVGPMGDSFQAIGGPAVCASIACFGDTALSGAFTTGILTIGGMPAGSTTLTPGILDLAPGTSMTGTQSVAILDGAILVSASATLAITGALTLGGGAPDPNGPAALLSAMGGGQVAAQALVMGGGSGDTLETDATSSIEIGTLGGAAAGAVTIDPGIAVGANGDINQNGAVVVDGTLTALGGTLIVGNTSGTGMLVIGAAATLELAGTETCPIDMAGAGATLLLLGSEETPAALIENFAAGDLIVTGSSQVGSLAYAPGAGGVGTLTLYSGGEVAGILLLGGNFSGDTFTLQPDGDGSAIAVQASGGPSQGTTTPDQYVWIGGGAGNWNSAANWQDISAGQDPAAVAPGVNDLVTIVGGAHAFTAITGPANAATLTLQNEVALDGQYAVGVLAVGQGAGTGLLALGAGDGLQAAQVAVAGGIVQQGGVLLCTGTLALQSGVLVLSDQASLATATLILAGAGDDISVDATSRLDVGNAGAPPAGDIAVDAGALLAGAGVLNAAGMIVDQGTITATNNGAGTALAIGAVTGAGTLLVGVGATMILQGAAAAALLIDFAGPGTLAVTGTLPQAAIAGFGTGDEIIIPISGITGAVYAQTAPNLGILTLDAGNQAVAELTLVGVGLDQGFSVAGAAGGTIITTEPTDYGGGGSTMRGGQDTTGSGQIGIINSFAFWQDLPLYAQSALASFQNDAGGTSYVYTSPDGTEFGNYEPGYANIAVVAAPADDAGIMLPFGYEALLVQGNEPVQINDAGSSGDLLMGNAADDTITGYGAGDTLIGGIGGNSLIVANSTDTIYGNGNDTIMTANGPCNITTFDLGRSVVFAGPAANVISLEGADTLVAAAGNGAEDSVNAAGSDTVFGPSLGQLVFYGGTGADAVVGTGGTIEMFGAAANGSVLWCGNASAVEYIGRSGAASIVGGAGALQVEGGAGALTVFGGTGTTMINGADGPSRFFVGDGASTVTAASGNLVWIVGASNDSLIASGGDVTIWGANSSGNNVFQAGSGPSTISGGVGNDTFFGGSGAALLFGGGGEDTYTFTNGLAGGAATIADFNTSEDQIDLHGYSGYTSAVVNGNEVVSLNDGTTITLDKITSLEGVVIHQS